MSRHRIKEPMDLGTITTRVMSGSYYGIDHAQFAHDVNLVWSNCMEYNIEGSQICLDAERYICNLACVATMLTLYVFLDFVQNL